MSQEERLMILQMVADKKISASEGAELLKALDGREAGEEPDSAPVRPGPASPLRPPAPPLPPPPLTGLGPFIEGVVEKVTSALSDLVEPRYEFPEEYTGKFTADDVPVRIVTGNGRIEVRAWDEPTFKANLLVRTSGASEEEARRRSKNAYTLKATESGFDLEARRGETLFSDLAVHVTLMVPRAKRYRLECRTGNGRVELQGIDLSDANVTSGNGRLTTEDCIAERGVFKSGNGSIEVTGDVADLEAKSGNGSVTVTPTGARSRSLRLSTGNGSIRVMTGSLGSDARYRVEASAGIGSVAIGLEGLVYDQDMRAMAHKHVIARSTGYDSAEQRVLISAKTGMGSVSIG